MTRFLIDPPVLLAIAQEGVSIHSDHQLVAPHAVRVEAMELLLTEVAAGTMPEAAALELHDAMTAVKIRTLGDRGSRGTAWKLARKHGWASLGRAEYLAIGVLQADALVALDQQLATQATDILPLAPFSALSTAG
ncbi:MULTISPECIES: hypothetical protein [Micrococcaceae]|uniref:Type II toxin-antitoxin system VapC family toxin n=1 Tax=Glutamicibacter soli TaxID=453836 RepID=A0A365YKS1_9MICC|nr:MULTISPECIES: hypothetical protein [Micrococcaceae]RBM02614.1 hypothetical protein C1H84_04025 [Glutamicibacter soli]